MKNRFGIGALIGGAAAYFLTRDRIRRLVTRGAGRAERAGRAVGADVYGMSQHAQHLQEEPKSYDDATLAHKVESELFRPADVPKGQISVNAANGVVQLRGEVGSPELIDELVERARQIQGVRDVENLLHLPNAEPQMHQ